MRSRKLGEISPKNQDKKMKKLRKQNSEESNGVGGENQGKKSLKMKRNRENGDNIDAHKTVMISTKENDSKAKEKKKDKSLRKKKRESVDKRISTSDHLHTDTIRHLDSQNGMVKKSGKNKRKGEKSLEKIEKEVDDVYQISSGDEDCSRGMKKWVMEHHQSRPGLKILQQGIDEFITTHQAQLEEKRKEREAQAMEGGWTVVAHHKGRKKTTDSDTGVTVGSVAQAVVEDKMAKKKGKEVGLDFYRFQRREAQRNEIMMLQSKFEQDRKRIQQLRAARKFKPY